MQKQILKLLFFLTMFLILPNFAKADVSTIIGDPNNVTDCGTLNQAGITYTLRNDVSSTGSCFNMAAAGITLDLNGFTATYDAAALIIIPNGSFESDLVGNWDLSGAISATREAGTFINPVSLYDGDYAIKITTPTADQIIQSVDTVQLQPNTTYSLSGMVYNTLNDGITISIEIDGTVASKSQVGRTWRGFQYINAVYTTGNAIENHKINIRVAGASGVPVGAIFIDDIKVQRNKVYGVVAGPLNWWLLRPSDVSIYGTANNAIIKNGKITQGSGGGDFSHAVAIAPSSETFNINNVEFTLAGANSKAIVMNSGINALIYNNTFNHNTQTISSRDNYDGATIWSNFSGYNMNIHDNIFNTGVQAAIFLPQSSAGQIANEIHFNDITLQTRYAITAPGGFIHNNRVNCGAGLNSCRGLSASGQDTKIYDNVVSVQELPRNQEYNGCEAWGAYGMQMEYAANNVEVGGNTVTANADVCEAHAFRANPTIATAANNVVHENTFIAIANGSTRASAIKYSQMNDTAIDFHDNTLRTNSRWIYLGGEGAVTNPVFNNNKWETVGILPAQFWPFEVSTYGNTHFTGTFNNNTYGSLEDKARFEGDFFRTAVSTVDSGSSFNLTFSDIVAPTAPNGLSVM